MRALLISIDLVLGVRVLINVLKDRKMEAHSLQVNGIKYSERLSGKALEDIYQFCKGYDVVGLSFNSFYSVIAAELGKFLKSKGVKWLVAGGPHPTAMPQEVLEYADAVLIYEAEHSLPALLQEVGAATPNLENISGVMYKDSDGQIRMTGIPEVEKELDRLPFPNFSPDDITFYNFEEHKFEAPTIDTIFPRSGRTWIILASRGCPFNCTYCCNNLFSKLDKKFLRVRKRSIPNIIEEMTMAKEAGFKQYYITDDNFFAFTLEEIQEFARLYQEQIDLPFSVVGLHPNNMKPKDATKKLDLLLSCGLSDARIGVQSGSPKTLAKFNRKYDPRKLPQLLKPFENRKTIWGEPNDMLRIAIDFICDSPWEDEEDKVATLKLANNLLSTYGIFFYTLIYLPGTEIYETALAEGWLKDVQRDIYLRGIAGVEDNIYNRLLFLIAVLKERGSRIGDDFISHVLSVYKSSPQLAEDMVDSMLGIVKDVEKHHRVTESHMTMHPYLKGFNKWEKKVGEKGKKVLFRSYHAAYG